MDYDSLGEKAFVFDFIALALAFTALRLATVPR